jgi:hypothetical protein
MGEYQADVSARFQDFDGFLSICGLQTLKTGIVDEVQGTQPDERVIFDHKNNCTTQ